MLRDRGRGWGWTLRYDMDSMRTCLGLAQAVDATGAWVVGGGGMLMFLEDATCSALRHGFYAHISQWMLWDHGGGGLHLKTM